MSRINGLLILAGIVAVLCELGLVGAAAAALAAWWWASRPSEEDAWRQKMRRNNPNEESYGPER